MRRQEEHQPVNADLDGAVDQRQVPDFQAFQGGADAAGFRLPLLLLKLSNQRLFLFVVQESRFGRRIIKPEPGEDPHDDRRNAFDKEHPEPAGFAEEAVHFQKRPGDGRA